MNSVDRTAIENLVFRYARYVDTAQYDALGALFAHGKVTTNKTDQVFVGKDAVRESLAHEQQALRRWNTPR